MKTDNNQRSDRAMGSDNLSTNSGALDASGLPAPSARGRKPNSGEPGHEKRRGGSGRDAAGRFTAGNRGGPGNPFARRVGALRSALLSVFTEEKLRLVVDSLLERAACGDIPAAKLVLLYGIGKPSDTVDPDQLEVDEWQKVVECSLEDETTCAVADGVAAAGAAAATPTVLNTIEQKPPEDQQAAVIAAEMDPAMQQSCEVPTHQVDNERRSGITVSDRQERVDSRVGKKPLLYVWAGDKFVCKPFGTDGMKRMDRDPLEPGGDGGGNAGCPPLEPGGDGDGDADRAAS